MPVSVAEEAVAEQAEDRHQVDVGRGGEDRAALADAAQVAEAEQDDEADADRARGSSKRPGKSEVSAATPAAIETATVST